VIIPEALDRSGRRREQPVRGHPVQPWARLHRDDRHRPLGEPEPHKDADLAILRAIEHICGQGPRTQDMGGTGSTEEVGRANASAII